MRKKSRKNVKLIMPRYLLVLGMNKQPQYNE